MDHEENVIAAAVLAVADRVRSAAEDAAGRSGGVAAALTMIYGWAEGQPIDALAAGLGLSHSRTVRVVDALVADGLIRRESDPTDARRALVRLTAPGRQTCERMLEAREAALRAALSALDDQQRAVLARISERVLAGAVSTRAEARRVCRFCDTQACGHQVDRCPVTRTIDHLDDRSRRQPT